jgi:hypothetical protein
VRRLLNELHAPAMEEHKIPDWIAATFPAGIEVHLDRVPWPHDVTLVLPATGAAATGAASTSKPSEALNPGVTP